MSSLSIIIVSVLTFCIIQQGLSQCPQDPGDLLINTQEKYENIFEKYPNCKEFRIVMFDGEFIGDPRPIEYLITLSVILLAILLTLKVIFRKIKII